MEINKLVAGAKGVTGNSTGSEIADTVNKLVDNSSVLVAQDFSELQKRFIEGLRATPLDASYNYIVTGDSTRDNDTNQMIDYYKKQLPKIGFDVVDDSRSGISPSAWISGQWGEVSSLQHAIDSTPNTGKNTILEMSLGLNGDGTGNNEVYIQQGIEAYLAAKPDALVLLVSPVGSLSGMAGTRPKYTALAEALGIPVIHASYATDGIYRDPLYYTDDVHPNQFGSMRLLNWIMTQILPLQCCIAMDMEDAPKQPLPDVSFSPVLKNGVWNINNGGFFSSSSKRSFELLDVEPNFILEIDHGGELFSVTAYEEDGSFIQSITSELIEGNRRKITIPSGCYKVGINITDDAATWLALDYPYAVNYIINTSPYMRQAKANEGLVISLPYTASPNVDDGGNLPEDGKVATGQSDGTWLWV